MDMKVAKKKLGIKERYGRMTRGLAFNSLTRLSGSFMSPKCMAPPMQVATQAGSILASRRWMQNWHLRALPTGEPSPSRRHPWPENKSKSIR